MQKHVVGFDPEVFPKSSSGNHGKSILDEPLWNQWEPFGNPVWIPVDSASPRKSVLESAGYLASNPYEETKLFVRLEATPIEF